MFVGGVLKLGKRDGKNDVWSHQIRSLEIGVVRRKNGKNERFFFTVLFWVSFTKARI